MKGLQRLFLGSAGGVLLFLAVEVIFLLIAWLGKVGSDLLIGLALLLHLGFAYAVLLNLLPILSLAIGGYAAGAAPQTGQNAGSGAASAVTGYIRISQGISHAVTLMILSLFLLDYQFNIATYLFVGLLLLAWGQYALVFPGSLRWPRQAAFFVLVAVSLGALAVSLSPDVAKFLTGRAFWSGEVYKEAAIAERQQGRSIEAHQTEAIRRVSHAIAKHDGPVTDDVLKSLAGREFSKEDLALYFAVRDGDRSSLITIFKSWMKAASHTFSSGSVQEPLVKIGRGSSGPKIVTPGQRVAITFHYSVLLPQSHPNASISESWTVKKEGVVMAPLPPAVKQRTAGDWAAATTFLVPANVPPGTYAVEFKVKAGSSYDTSEHTFVVKS
jgi:hypothetical protein